MAGLCVLAGACGTVDPGDNFVAPEVQLDEDAFFCKVQPQVIGKFRCASGGPEDSAGGCHADMTAMRLDPEAEMAKPGCEDNMVTGSVPESFRHNLDAVRTAVQSDALSSPLYRRPVGLDAHPRSIFDEGSEPAQIIADWINAGGT